MPQRGHDPLLIDRVGAHGEQTRDRHHVLHSFRERKVGIFEGANGYAKGVFRSEVDCIMFSLQTDYFCAACSAAIERMIDEHCR